ncbi:MAG: type I DNA topoisomerase, partial [Oscillospiraceae bacterium]|nr:type I DNA topoisomerase [Oscillospiraceae bacterium]
EREIDAFIPKEYWTLDVHLRCVDKEGGFVARYFGETKKRELTCEAEVNEILEDIKGKDFTIASIKRSEKRRSPTPPFITSTLQQEASRQLNMTPRRTMAVAQQLYEGVEITGEGSVGLITYMRTDSLRLSDEALMAAKSFILSRYGQNYYAGSPRRFRKKDGAQDAHEAIRPSDVNLDPERIKNDLTKEQYKLYKLIWSRFVACQMAEALYDSVQIDTLCAGHLFRAGEQIMKFPGFTAVYEEGRDDDEEEKNGVLPKLDGTERLRSEKHTKEQHFTVPPARYTEATLVKAMEERGVGRPSTYAAIVATIQDRDYVLKKEKRLYPTPLGEVVTDLMLERFNDIIDVEFTANMERRLDEVEAGNIRWKQILRDFYAGFHASMVSAEQALEGKRIKVPEEVSQEICEVCGKNMVVKFGRFGPFLACPGFPECSNTKPIVERMPGHCPKCGSTILKRKSKRGYVFYACERGAECGFMTWDVPTEQECACCGQTMFKRSGKGAMKPFCINEECSNFLPEDKRGYKRRMPKATTETVDNAQELPENGRKKTGAKKGTKKK